MAKQMHVMDYMGLKGVDKVTGFKGVVTSVSYDLYGCIQVILTPEVDEKGKREDGRWYDVQRIKTTTKKPVIPVPDFGDHNPVLWEHGPAEKPIK